jgi:hypothetical protein
MRLELIVACRKCGIINFIIPFLANNPCWPGLTVVSVGLNKGKRNVGYKDSEFLGGEGRVKRVYPGHKTLQRN